jgi:pimeloyl-ACP methyl ester carboxylesterase
MLAASLAMLSLSAKPVAVMIHGAGGGGWEYTVWQKLFEEAGYEVLAFDLVPSEGGYQHTSYPDYVKQVESWVVPGTRPKVVIGASLGGILALSVERTLKPERLILINSALPKPFIEKQALPPPPEIIRWANGPIKDTEDSMPDSDRQTIEFAWKRWRDESGRVIYAIRRGISVPKPKAKTLVIISENDDTVPAAKSQQLAKWLKGDVHFYKGMSHVGPLLARGAPTVAKKALEWLGTPLED